jgi:hypothetical protein
LSWTSSRELGNWRECPASAYAAGVNHHYSDPQEIREIEREHARKRRKRNGLLARIGKAVAHARMKAVTVEGSTCIVQSGTVRLTAEQARPRRHNLKALNVTHDGAGEYEVVAPIQFKRGETFLFEGQALTRDQVIF